jgi:cytochrome P450
MEIPESGLDLWSDQAILDPYPLYRELRDTAPAVWLASCGMVALSRYADVRRRRRDPG